MVKMSELRQLEAMELNEKLKSLRSKLLELRFKRSSHQLTNPLELRWTRRSIARILALLNEKGVKNS